MLLFEDDCSKTTVRRRECADNAAFQGNQNRGDETNDVDALMDSGATSIVQIAVESADVPDQILPLPPSRGIFDMLRGAPGIDPLLASDDTPAMHLLPVEEDVLTSTQPAVPVSPLYALTSSSLYAPVRPDLLQG